VAVYLMLNLSLETWIRFVIWMALGFIIYFGYSRHRSRLAVHGRESDRAAAGQATPS
jgi:basic amino acid/polyamine antiporter, APA family